MEQDFEPEHRVPDTDASGQVVKKPKKPKKAPTARKAAAKKTAAKKTAAKKAPVKKKKPTTKAAAR